MILSNNSSKLISRKLLLHPILLLSVADGTGKKKRKKGEDAPTSDEGTDDERPRKRGRPRATNKEVIKGFTDSEVLMTFILLSARSRVVKL